MAKDLGLVDELGGIDKALNAAASQAGIENYSIIGDVYKRQYIYFQLFTTKITVCLYNMS